MQHSLTPFHSFEVGLAVGAVGWVAVKYFGAKGWAGVKSWFVAQVQKLKAL